MRKVFEKISRIIRITFMFWVPYALWRNSRRLKKWLKKNKKTQDPNLYDYYDRFSYIRKKAKKFNKRIGVKVNVIGLDNLPKSASWITPNHSSNFDGFFLLEALGSKTHMIPIAREDLFNKRIASGFLKGADAFVLNTVNIRQTVTVLNNAANYGKQNNRSIVVFPEGTRSLTTNLSEFKCGNFKFPQKYALPVVPVSITGTLQARRWWKLSYRTVNVKIHKPIKAIEHIKIPSDILCKRVYEKIEKDLKDYENSLSFKEKKYLMKLKKRGQKRENKKNNKLEKERKNFIKEN